MPYAVKISAEHRLGIVRLAGLVDGETILRGMDELYHGETWVPTFNMIWDCRPIARIAVGPREAQRILERLNGLTPRMGQGRTAVVSPKQIVAAFVYMLFVRDDCAFRERRVFRELDAALKWVSEVYPEQTGSLGGDLPIAPV